MKKLYYKDQEVSINNLVELIKVNLELSNDGHPSSYLTIKCKDDENFYESFQIRVSNHSSNKRNNRCDKHVSFISNRCDQGYNTAYGQEYLVDDIEDMLTDETNSRGYLSVYEILEDLIDSLKVD